MQNAAAAHILYIPGFIYIINFGLTQQEVDEQYEIAREFFALPLDERMACRCNLDEGDFIGYQPCGHRELKPGVRGNNELYNIPRFGENAPRRKHPSTIIEHWSRIEQFSRYVHEQIVMKLLRLFEMVLLVPEGHFGKLHLYEEEHSSYLRYMKYHARTAEQNAALDNVWLRGHTDFGSLSILFRQPITSLQVRTQQGEWKYVRPYPESITMNVGDQLQFLSNGFFKSSVHRVVAPPADQAHLDRLGVLYFARVRDDAVLAGAKSPVLRKENLMASDEVILAKDWVKARTLATISARQNEFAVDKHKLDAFGNGLRPTYA